MTWNEALGWTLLHFLWEGALIAAFLAGALALVRNANARVRYAASCAAMAAMLAAAAATFVSLRTTALPESMTPALSGTILVQEVRAIDAGFRAAAVRPSLSATASAYLPALVWGWLAGVIALSVRAAAGWAMAERFARRHTWRAEAIWEERLAALARRLRVSAPVRLMVSGLAEVPGVVGWWRPVVLIPASLFSGLSSAQIDALLAHEMAHIRRHDYLFNLLQTAVETLFFYHPAVWWVSRKIREERENCCDDLAVDVCGNVVDYVRALADLEQMRRSVSRFAMAASGGSLLSRIQRLLGVQPSVIRVRSSWLAGTGAVATLLAAGLAVNGLAWQSKSETGATSQTPAPAATPQSESNTQQGNPEIETRNARPEPPQADVEAERVRADLERLQQEAERRNAETGELDEEGRRLNQEFEQLNAQIRQLTEAKIRARLQQQQMLLVQAAAQLQQAAQAAQPGQPQSKPGWLDQIEAEGYRNLTVDQLIRLKESGVTGEYIRQVRSAGLQPSLEEWPRLREHGVTADYINEMKQAGLQNLTLNDVVRLREHGASPAWVREIQSAGFPNLSINDILRLREHGVTPESARDARSRLPNLTVDQLVRLKEHGIF
jgi:beta-lactamase regulating signal transducer with metallopeptidase domain